MLEAGQYYEGVVVDIYDPDKNGRLKVNILGKTDGLSKEDLPFARVLYPLSELDVSEQTTQLNTRVLLIAVNGDVNSLVILGRFKHKSQLQ